MKISECKEGNINFAEISNEYIEVVKASVAKPHVCRWWIDSEFEEIFQDTTYKKNELFIHGSTIICIDNVTTGLSQMYFSASSSETILSCGECGLRFFIGDTDYLKQKLGTVIIGKLVEGIFCATKIERIVCEPQADNGLRLFHLSVPSLETTKEYEELTSALFVSACRETWRRRNQSKLYRS